MNAFLAVNVYSEKEEAEAEGEGQRSLVGHCFQNGTEECGSAEECGGERQIVIPCVL